MKTIAALILALCLPCSGHAINLFDIATRGVDLSKLPPPQAAPKAAPKPQQQTRPRYRPSRDEYVVEISHNDEFFMINREKFSARTYCFDVEEGDTVIFIEGSAYGACASAEFLNLRTKEVCEVWCD